MSAREIDDWRDFFEAEAAVEALVAKKVPANLASEMVWMGPKQRAERDEMLDELDAED